MSVFPCPFPPNPPIAPPPPEPDVALGAVGLLPPLHAMATASKTATATEPRTRRVQTRRTVGTIRRMWDSFFLMAQNTTLAENRTPTDVAPDGSMAEPY